MHNSKRMVCGRRRTGVLQATVRQILMTALLGCPLVLPAVRAADDSQPEVGLQEIVVTAQRRQEDV